MYEGEFQQSMRHGKGIYTHANGDVYHGECKKKHGKGVMTWSDGNKYIGHFQNGLRHGYGNTYNDGRGV